MPREKRSIKFKPQKIPRLPKAPDATELRGTLREISRQLRVARESYMRRCQEVGAHLRGKALADYILLVAERMIVVGLYSDLPSVGHTAYCVMLWFARFEAGNDYFARHRDWPKLRGMTREIILDMRGGKHAKRIDRSKIAV